VFVAMLCSEPDESGSVLDSECNSSDEEMWNIEGKAPAQATPDGRFLVFSTATDLTAPEDTSTVGQVFRYDAQTGELARVSIGQRGLYECPATKSIEAGFNCNGNTGIFEAGSSGGMIEAPTAERPVAISEDGSVVFQSADGLTPEALNGQAESFKTVEIGIEHEEPYFANNVYEYRDGEVSLISDGLDTSATGRFSSVHVEGMAPSGADVFFTTADRLVGQDTDTQQNIYDARIDGGFPPPPVATPCQEEACQGPPSPAPLFGAPSSATFSGAGNLVSPAPTSVLPVVGRVKVLGHSVHGTTITLTVAAPTKGTIVAYGAGLQTTKHRVDGATTYTLKVALSARARASVKRLRRHKLRYKRKLTVRVRFVPTSGKASQTSVLAMVKA